MATTTTTMPEDFGALLQYADDVAAVRRPLFLLLCA